MDTLPVRRDDLHRDEVDGVNRFAVHAEGVDLSVIGDPARAVPAHAARAEDDRTLPHDAGLALDPQEPPVTVVDDEVVARRARKGPQDAAARADERCCDLKLGEVAACRGLASFVHETVSGRVLRSVIVRRGPAV